MISELWIDKDLEGNDRGLIEHGPEFGWRDWRKPRKTSVRIAGLWDEIWTLDVVNT
jgi:hypothetical protein